MSPFARAVVSMGLLSLLLFFADIIFSESLHRDCETTGPLSSNLFGSVVEAADFFGRSFNQRVPAKSIVMNGRRCLR